ncbi:MAG: DUF3618 domain-containing protein [Pyrinomonadaceae bacterium]
MAQKPSELTRRGTIDPVAANIGANSDPALARMTDNAEYAAMESQERLENTGDQPEDTEQLKAQIEETRKEMGETIDAIQEKLSFSNISEQVSEQVSNVIETAKDTAYDATIGKAVNFMKTTGEGIANSGVVRTVSENPFPFVLIGLGAGLLAYQTYGGSSRKLSRYRSYNPDGRYLSSSGRSQNWEGRDEGRPSMAMRETGRTQKGNGALDTVKGAAGDAYESVSGAAAGAYETASDAVSEAYSGAGNMMRKAYDSAGEYGSKAYDTYDHYMDENPLVIGAVAAAVGAAVGMAIPATHLEGRLVGETRDNLLDKAQSKAGDLIDRAKQVASEAGETIKDEANKALSEQLPAQGTTGPGRGVSNR